MQQTIVKGDALQRIASLGFLVGGVLSLVFGPLRPSSEHEDKLDVIQTIVDNSGFWEVDHLLIVVGFWAVTIGVIGVYRAIASGQAAAWARLGFYGVLVGTALWSVLFALDGAGYAVVAEQWEKASGADKAAWFTFFSGMDHLLDGMRSMAVFVYWSAFIFLGVGVAFSKVYPSWLGWFIALVGVLGAATGFGVGVAGTNDAYLVTFIASLALTSVWALLMGIWAARKAW